MVSEHWAHSTPLPVGFGTWLWRYTWFLLLISTLWNRQAIFGSKGNKTKQAVEKNSSVTYLVRGPFLLTEFYANFPIIHLVHWVFWERSQQTILVTKSLVSTLKLWLYQCPAIQAYNQNECKCLIHIWPTDDKLYRVACLELLIYMYIYFQSRF